ncbi:MAG: tyrosine-type recombinase/integrase [Phycisphaerae bacterium]
MRVFKSVFRDRKTGQARQTGGWYVEVRDAGGQPRRLPALSTKAQSEEFGRKVEQLVAYRVAGSPLDPQLIRWVESLPPKMVERLLRLDLLDPRFVGTVRPLADHLVDFEAALRAKDNTPQYVVLKVARVRKILEGCGLRYWSDISASRVQTYLAGLRTGAGKMSAQTFNFYLQAFKQFCRWLYRDRRAGESPVHHLPGLNAKLDKRHPRRALSVEEMGWLLHAAETGPERGRVPGPERALLFRVAAETGLRAGELASLTVSSFSLDTDPPLVRVQAGYSKHRCEDVQIVKKATEVLLKQHFASKMPASAAFRMPSKEMRARVVRADLAAARSAWLASAPDPKTQAEMITTDFLTYKDSAGRFADFHSFRHATGSFLAAAGVSPKVAQSIMRHGDINLTMTTYSHAYREDEAAAVEKLPDLGRRPDGKRQADAG